jgi:hypothetical protein
LCLFLQLLQVVIRVDERAWQVPRMRLRPITPKAGRIGRELSNREPINCYISHRSLICSYLTNTPSQHTSKELDLHMTTYPIIQSLITPNTIHCLVVSLTHYCGCHRVSPADDYQYPLPTQRPNYRPTETIMNRLATRGRKLNLCHKWLVSRTEKDQTRESLNPPDSLFQTSDHKIKSNPRQGIWGSRSSRLLHIPSFFFGKNVFRMIVRDVVSL